MTRQYSARIYGPVMLIGAGGIGSNVLSLLVKLGPSRLTIIDDDCAESVNLAQQQFTAADLGRGKAEALASIAHAMDPELPVVAECRRFGLGDRLDGIVCAAVDSMQSRRVIFDEACRQKDRVPLFIDGRLSRKAYEWAEVYFIDPKRDDEVAFYREWLYDDRELGPDGPRPTEFSAHTPILLAGLIGAGIARWLREGSHPLKVTCDAATFTLESV